MNEQRCIDKGILLEPEQSDCRRSSGSFSRQLGLEALESCAGIEARGTMADLGYHQSI